MGEVPRGAAMSRTAMWFFEAGGSMPRVGMKYAALNRTVCPALVGEIVAA
jgi:hypothetical protein